MDGLALLCTLHADGPTTVKRLRQIGCASLGDLEALGAEEISKVLEVPPATARRLLRESRLLLARLGSGLLDRDEEPRASGDPARPEPAGVEPPALDRVDRAILDRVLARWREHDAAEPLAADASEDPRIPRRPAPAPTGTELRAGLVDGLSPERVAALAAAGLSTLEELAGADGLWLARGLCTSFADVRRLQFLARRAIGAVPVALAPAVLQEPAADPVPRAWEEARAEASAPEVAATPPAAVAPMEAPAKVPMDAAEAPAEAPRTVLNWNFEVPRPSTLAAPREEAGGPFA